MKKIYAAIAGLVLLATMAYAESYSITVTRKAKDVYKVDGIKVVIFTKHCFEFATMDDAVLRYDSYDKWNNKLIFVNSGAVCDVEEVVS